MRAEQPIKLCKQKNDGENWHASMPLHRFQPPVMITGRPQAVLYLWFHVLCSLLFNF